MGDDSEVGSGVSSVSPKDRDGESDEAADTEASSGSEESLEAEDGESTSGSDGGDTGASEPGSAPDRVSEATHYASTSSDRVGESDPTEDVDGVVADDDIEAVNQSGHVHPSATDRSEADSSEFDEPDEAGSEPGQSESDLEPVDFDEDGDDDLFDDGLFGGDREGPEDDREMPLADHIEEMIKRLAIVIVVAGSVSLVTFPLTDRIIVHIWYSVLPGTEVAQPRVYGPLEFLLARIQVASLAGLIVALPVVVYETYAFMRPGLYKNERKYYLAAIPTSLVLAVIGVLFAYFIVLPAIFTYFLAYTQEAAEIAFGLQRTFGLMLILMAYLAIVFQIPLFIMLAIMMGLTTRAWLADKRLYFWGAFLGIAFISSPDPTGMAPIIIAITMVVLYEGTLFILKWVGR